jgi:hypothetical protein
VRVPGLRLGMPVRFVECATKREMLKYLHYAYEGK